MDILSNGYKDMKGKDNMVLNIIKATLDDAYNLSYVHALSWKEAYKGIVPDEYAVTQTVESGIEKMQKMIINKPDANYIAELDGKAIGRLAIHECYDEDLPDAGEIGALYILPDFWGKGYGKEIAAFALKELKSRGYSRVSLWTLEQSTRATGFYERVGFVLDGAKKTLDFGIPLIAVRYRMELIFENTGNRKITVKRLAEK